MPGIHLKKNPSTICKDHHTHSHNIPIPHLCLFHTYINSFPRTQNSEDLQHKQPTKSIIHPFSPSPFKPKGHTLGTWAPERDEFDILHLCTAISEALSSSTKVHFFRWWCHEWRMVVVCIWDFSSCSRDGLVKEIVLGAIFENVRDYGSSFVYWFR